MSDFLYSCYCYSCCFWVFVLLLDCCCFPPKLSFVVRTRAAMCWFFWIPFGYSPSANEGPSQVLKSWRQMQWCWKQKSRVVGSEHIHTLHVPHTHRHLNHYARATPYVYADTRVRVGKHRRYVQEWHLPGEGGGCIFIKGHFPSAHRTFSWTEGWREFLGLAGSYLASLEAVQNVPSPA